MAKIDTQIKNRRFVYTIKKSRFFEPLAIKKRNPALYEAHFGPQSRKLLSEQLFELLDKQDAKPTETENLKGLNIAEIEAQMVKTAKELFINGQEDFDYQTVDENPEFDDWFLVDADLESAYFDAEEPSL